MASVGAGVRAHSLRRPFHQDTSSAFAAFWPQIDDPVGGLDDIEVVLDDDHGVALVAQAVQYFQELRDVMEVQAGGRLVQDVERPAGRALRKLLGQFDALCLATGKSGSVLAQTHIGKPDVEQGL